MNKPLRNSLLAIGSLIVLTIVFFIIRGLKSPVTEEVQITEYLKNIKAYKSDVIIEMNNSKQNLTYNGKQAYMKNSRYILELEDERVFDFNSDQLVVKDKHNNREYALSSDFDEVLKYCFIGEFIGLLYTNEEINYSIDQVDDTQCLAIDLLLPGINKNIHRGVMYINLNNGLPKEFRILDIKGKEKVKCTYENFIELEKIEDYEFEGM
ncbi:germination lipoprotein GerS-related protein [Clostridium sp. UBA6640]|uniref:germination lipoprotein GerS-related protein n=1 Tax=Clostridium sp. UBA6640 TaxID=1946370 RepID=UPI0025C6BC54|nr:germination lipoprotein GerS-related protein [Clostridium sp. UBA6640]